MYEYHQATKSLLDRIFETNKENCLRPQPVWQKP